MPEDIAEKVISIIASVKHIPREKITVDSSLAELGFDSLDTISMLFELESAFQISIPDEKAREIRYVREIVSGIQTLTSGQASSSAASLESVPSE